MVVLLVAARLLLSAPAAAGSGDGGNVYALPRDEFVAQARRDLATLRLYAGGLRRLQGSLRKEAGLSGRDEKVPYTPEQKAALLSTWGAFFSYFISTEAIRQRYLGFVKVPPTDATRHLLGYVLAHAALTTELSQGLAFSDRTAGHKQMEVLLDEPNAEFGVPSRAFAELKVRSIHVATTTQLLTGDAYGRQVLPWMKEHKLLDAPEVAWAVEQMKEGSKAAREKLARRGVALFAIQAGDILKDSALGALFPVQKGVAEWMGDTRVWREGKPLVRREQVLELLGKMEPGDIVVVRQNWYLSNIGLPGFWPHAELYLGTPEVLSAYFDGDPEVKRWVGSQVPGAGTLSALLEARWPERYRRYASGKDLLGQGPIRVIEAISEGVSFTSIEHAMLVDYLGVMRPRLSKREKAMAIARAFSYQGRPYDFDFDFLSDSTLVCTELVWKSYAPSAGMKGLVLPLVEVAGRQTLPANEIVKRFDLEMGSPRRQLDFVAFLDGREGEGDAVPAGVEAFRRSHARPKWDIVQR